MLETLIKKATGGIDGLVDDLVKAASDKIKQKIAEAFSIQKLLTLKENITRVGKVKTILDPDSIKNIEDIFLENAISFSNHQIIKNIGYFSSNHILIEGGPGQGKSMYLRWLCINESKSSFHIPIFIEFRNLHYQKSLKEELFDAIKDFGVELDSELFDFVAKSEKIVFILDCFDEIPNSVRMRVARELETIARTYPSLRIIISSRPDSGMGASVYFVKYIINPLSKECQDEFVRHLYGQDGQSRAIIDILSNNSFLTEVTNTPLLLTLFTITYNARQFKPDSLAEFYGLLFPTMLYRHDRLKIGYERERSAGLTDYQMQRIFEALSFISLKSNKTRFPSTDFRAFLESSSKLERIEANLEDKIIDDITRITALIIRDGFDFFSFSHKSIQEYFSSAFISRLADERKEQFYSVIIDNFNEYIKWQNCLNFLSTIDEKCFTKYFLLPFKRKALNLNSKNVVKINYTMLLGMLGIDSKTEVTENGKIINVFWGDTLYSAIYTEYSIFTREVLLKFLKSKRVQIANFISYSDVEDYEKYRRGENNFIFSIDLFIRGEHLENEICRHLSEQFKNSEIIQSLLLAEKNLIESEIMADDILNF